ncbi:MerC mercury resistance protein [Tamilnaduibacter salinus]|uniref:MerC mercury resistance protein n=1 Tax=Tamilnaduibacter salinus TaxID=1484056 RepID=A0A2A2I2I7_9GAMM|nr:MerC domain-containing protein [Tamilnaduibacter salinus]PAV25526.1 hypothetical protein CF392_10585 [Tamilnaduibacter salinus]PVY77354.1 MerC mercury resistance protein [Tamilnaduibacter salinus]
MGSAVPSQWLDRLAIGMSTLCALHCLLLPFALVLIPTLGASFLGDAAFHRALLWLVIPSSLLAVGLGCSRHRDRQVWGYALAGLTVMTVAAFWGHGLFGEWGEKLVTLSGAGLLCVSHLRNHRLCRQDHCDHEAGEC